MRATFDHPYPTTKIIWIPDSVSTCKTFWLNFGVTSVSVFVVLCILKCLLAVRTLRFIFVIEISASDYY